MDNKPWDKARLTEWKKFWDSEMGQEALSKMRHLKELCLTHAMTPTDPNTVAYYVGRAGGIDLVLRDIEAGFTALEELGKEGTRKSK